MRSRACALKRADYVSFREGLMSQGGVDDPVQIYERICADCWNDWFRNYSIKVINELRLDLSTERGQAEYDRYMREFLGLD